MMEYGPAQPLPPHRSPQSKLRRWPFVPVAFLLASVAFGCGVTPGGPPPGAFLGIPGVYNYSPSALQIGNLQQFWWCGQAQNPARSSQFSDTIQYATLNVFTHQMQGPVTVLAETPGTWDSVYACNPKVIGGTFTNPFADGKSYSYAMYYVGTPNTAGNANAIGAAFSNDGVHWRKLSQPVILPSSQSGYGVGQPAVYNSDRKSGIWLFYEDSTGPVPYQHVQAVSTDGVHFRVAGTLTTNGLDTVIPGASWGDMACDASAKYWYAVFNLPLRDPSTTGNVTERGQPGVALFRIPAASLLSGSAPWQLLRIVDTNSVGNESVFIAGLLRDQYGRVNTGSYPAIQFFTSISDPSPPWNASPSAAAESAEPPQWDIGVAQWTPTDPPLALNRYANPSVHEVTTGWIDPTAKFTLQSTLGHLYESPQHGAALALYGCKAGSFDYFVSTDSSCAGKRLLGLEGYGYPQPQPGLNLVALYSCAGAHDHFVSTDPQCEGQPAPGQLLGYALP